MEHASLEKKLKKQDLGAPELQLCCGCSTGDCEVGLLSRERGIESGVGKLFSV